MFKCNALWFLVLLLSVGSGLGQNRATPQSSAGWNERILQLSFMNRAEAEYRLGSGDLIEVSVFGVADYTYNLRINSRGQLNFPLVGNIDVKGMTPSELEETLRFRFEDRLVRNPQISIFVKEYRSQPVFILGAVERPGQYQAIHQLNVVDVIAMAGGLQLGAAADHALIQRAKPSGNGEGKGSEVIKVDLRALLEEGNVALNVPVQGGDVIQIPERKVDLIYIMGDVNKPGAFTLPRDYKNIVVTQVLAQAGGPTRTAKLSKGIVVRYDEKSDSRQELALDLKKVIQGKDPDISVLPDDIIFIPSSTGKTIGYGMLGILPQFVSNAMIVGSIQPR